MNTKELIVSELESTSEELLSEVLKFVKSIKRQHPVSLFSIDKAFDGYSITYGTLRDRENLVKI